jgi:hypothetical protein
MLAIASSRKRAPSRTGMITLTSGEGAMRPDGGMLLSICPCGLYPSVDVAAVSAAPARQTSHGVGRQAAVALSWDPAVSSL